METVIALVGMLALLLTLVWLTDRIKESEADLMNAKRSIGSSDSLARRESAIEESTRGARF